MGPETFVLPACLVILALAVFRSHASGKLAMRLPLFGALFFCIVAGWTGAAWLGGVEERSQEMLILRDLKLIGEGVGEKGVQSLTGTGADLQSPHYRRLKSQLGVMKQSLPGVRFIYLTRIVNGRVVFLADSEPPGSQDESPPGQVYGEAPSALVELCRQGGKSRIARYEDRWGSFVSGFSMLADPVSGRSMAVVGMDVSAANFDRAVRQAKLKVVLLTIGLCAIALLVQHIYHAQRMFLERNQEWEIRPGLLRWGATLVTWLAGGVITLLAYWAGERDARQHFVSGFYEQASSRTHTIMQALQSSLQGLDGVRHFVEHSPSLSFCDFSGYSRTLTENSSVQAVEWVPLVAGAGRGAFERGERKVWGGPFRITERDSGGRMTPAGERGEYFPVQYIAPLEGNRPAHGFDLGSEPVRRQALERARDEGLPVATPPLQLVQEQGRDSGYLVFTPVYAGPSGTLAERRRHLRGFVVGVFRAGDTIGPVIRRHHPAGIEFRVQDYGVSEGSGELHHHLPRIGSPSWEGDDGTECERIVEFAGRTWGISARPGSAFVQENFPRWYRWIPLLGAIFTGLAAHLINLEFSGRFRLAVLVRERTEELAGEKQRLDLLLNSTAEAIYGIDLEGNCTFCNRACLELLGYDRQEELLDRNMHDLIHHSLPDGTSISRHECNLHLESERVHADDVTLWRRDGSSFAAEFWSYPQTRDREVVGSVVTFLDISARKESERELYARTEELDRTVAKLQEATLAAEEASRAKSRFLANMSHEIRTPMNGVIGMTGLLLESGLTDEQHQYAEMLHNSGESLLAIINDILDYSKIEAGRLELEEIPFEPRAVVEEVIDMLSVEAEKKGIELSALVAPDVPWRVSGDPVRLCQVLMNLAGNGVKFTPHGTVAIRVSLLYEKGNEAVTRFEVVDTGIGIPAERVESLFSAFTQADGSTTRRFGGTGLGLSISRRLVELMGGTISVESRIGAGSTFGFTVSLARLDDLPPPLLPTDLTGVRVLVVDDVAVSRLPVRMMLDSWGMRCDEAGDGEGALAMITGALEEGDPYRVVLLDMVMPGMDGEGVARTLRRKPELERLPLVMMTSLSRRAEMDRLVDLAFAAFLGKPVRQSSLAQAVLRALGMTAMMPSSCDETVADRGGDGFGARILVVEDVPVNQKLIVKLLEKQGYLSGLAANGLEALEALVAETYDLVLMDCQMPEMDGYEATMRIRAGIGGLADPHVPVIALTANAMPGDAERCLAAGMDDYLAKPVRSAELYEKLRKWLPSP